MADDWIDGLDALGERARHSPQVALALRLADRAHAGQERKDPGSPYVVHPMLVAQRLAQRGYGDDAVAAALLHDVVEDSWLTVAELRARFGDAVAELVDTLTDDPGIEDFERRKAAQRGRVEAAGPDAKAIFAADRTSNARELTRLLGELGAAAAERDKTAPDVRERVWRADLEMLDRVAPDLDLLDELRAAVEGFRKAVARLGS